ncbi:ABC transporter substrate-binding protein [Paenalcaligenes hominis]|uniref:ABC transporter substrate-binding protein n=1 Tax=Paenalcaligenes hominis TaxID=643674 RepID=UPI0035250C9D
MNRRALLKALGCSMLLSGGWVPSVVVAQALTQPHVTSPLFHVFGQLPEPVEVKRIFAARASAAVMLNSVAPAQLLGWSFPLPETSKQWLSETSRQLPVVGSLAGRGSTISSEQLMALHPDVIVDVGEVNEHYASLAKEFSEKTGIPYILIEGRIEDTPEQLEIVGALLGQQRHGQQLAQAAQGVLDYVKAKRESSSFKAPRIYLAHSATGLETASEQSIHSEIIRLVGATNVVEGSDSDGLTQVSMEQVLAWNPELILTQDKQFYQNVYQDSLWQDVPAVRNKQVLFVPSVPFGWIDVPPSINRLLGALWLSAWIHKENEHVLLEKMRHLFVMFYQNDPGAEKLKQLLVDPVQFAD